MNTYIFAFHTHSDAIQFERTCKKQGIVCCLMPIPRKLSSSCGIGALITSGGTIERLIDSHVESVHERSSKNAYHLVYEAQE